ncbi:MAG: T9SS type B sorting domain-containing protein [Burkholderiales bacterium]|nr:T9SS type B sorting domain-containing protein [Flavobacterium sp.]
MRLKYFFCTFLFVCSSAKSYSQCFQTESILVAACAAGGFEGYNEMVRFKVGVTPQNTSALAVNWPSNTWQGLIQNSVTASQVAALNSQVIAAGGCAQILEPVGGVLPANAKVILITSQNFNVGANIFGAITENIYVLFQNNSNVAGQGGHFGNYSATPGTRTLTISFGSCTDTVTYERSLLVDTAGLPGAAPGATVSFTPAGVASYTNLGCVAPVEVFAVDAGSTPITACPGAVVSLVGSAQGQQSVTWSAIGGTYSTPTTLGTNYTLPFSASGTVILTLSATNSCGTVISDNVTVNVNSGVTPTFNVVAPICSGASLAALPVLSNNGITGSWSPVLDNTATATYTFTPNPAQCATSASLIITVNNGTIPIFSPIAPICSGTALSPLPTISNNGITGNWSPALNTTATTTYTFMPDAGQCSNSVGLTIIVDPKTTPSFNSVPAVCSGVVLSPLPTTSINGITGTWTPAFNNAVTTLYTFTPASGQCANATQLTVVVNPMVTPTFSSVSAICAGQILAPLPTSSSNGIVGIWSPALNNTATTTYNFAPLAGQCATATNLTINVYNIGTLPTFSAIVPICAGGFLSALPTTSINGITGTWSPQLNNMVTTTYTFAANTVQCATPTTLVITVNPATIIPTFNPIASICSGASLPPLPTISTNGIAGVWTPALNNLTTTTYDFTPTLGQCATNAFLTVEVNGNTIPNFPTALVLCNGVTAPVLNPISGNGVSGTWQPAIIDNTANGIYVFTPNAGQCASLIVLTVTVTDNTIKNEKYYLCFDAAAQVINPVIINTGLSPLQYLFIWTLAGNTVSNAASYQANSAGIYTVVATNITTGCTTTTIAEVIESPVANANVVVESDFEAVQQIVITVTGGLGDYQYQLDYGPFQSSNIFAISRGGDYTINIIDNSGCNNFELKVTAISYPKFFSPNADGYHDTWNIEGLSRPQNTQLFIFDRYGKLLKELSTAGVGWDGTYNGIALPSSDYWFKLRYQNAAGITKEYKNHFTLKR